MTTAMVCRDPECLDPGTGTPSVAEPEQDGDLHYYACTTCGYEFGYTYAPGRSAITPAGDPASAEAKSSTGCPVGIPEAIRRRASVPMNPGTAPRDVVSTLPLLQIGRRA